MLNIFGETTEKQYIFITIAHYYRKYTYRATTETITKRWEVYSINVELKLYLESSFPFTFPFYPNCYSKLVPVLWFCQSVQKNQQPSLILPWFAANGPIWAPHNIPCKINFAPPQQKLASGCTAAQIYYTISWAHF